MFFLLSQTLTLGRGLTEKQFIEGGPLACMQTPGTITPDSVMVCKLLHTVTKPYPFFRLYDFLMTYKGRAC